VTIIMVTGDQATTAAAIAGQAWLGGGPVLQGGEPLDRLADQELSARLASHTVVARATPADKRRIVRLLQGRGEIVAVTGDGINDAPALAGRRRHHDGTTGNRPGPAGRGAHPHR
jgi:magnesium-transporting ATPase (P-type)